MKKRKACLISGGGAWGAYGGGTLQKINGDYDLIVGVSTGSLLAPLAALREWEVLKDGFTNVDETVVFDDCWYKGKPMSASGKIRKFPVLMTLLLGHKSVYTSRALRKTIDKFLPKKYFDNLIEKKKVVRVGTQNYAELPSKIHYFGSDDEKYEDFKDWVWCSACFPFFTSLVKKSWRDNEGNFHVGQWSDGGLSDLVGIDELMGKKFDEIDIILHRTHVSNKLETERVNSLVENVTTSISAMRHEVEFQYFREKIKQLNQEGAIVRVFWLPRKLSANSMVFDKKQMAEWWEEGFDTAFDSERIEVFKPIKRRF